MTTITGTVRRVWPRPDGQLFTVILQRDGDYRQIVTWTRDQWLASLCERYSDAAGRPAITAMYEPNRQLTGVALKVAA